MLSRIASFAVWALVAAAAVYWGLKLFVRAPAAPATLTVAAVQAPLQADWPRLFGADAVPQAAAAEPEPAADARFQLVGLVAPRGSGSVGVALIGVDGKPPRAYKPGAVIDGALVLQGIQSREVTLGPAGGAPQVRLLLPPLPVAATGVPTAAGPAVTPPAIAGIPPRGAPAGATLPAAPRTAIAPVAPIAPVPGAALPPATRLPFGLAVQPPAAAPMQADPAQPDPSPTRSGIRCSPAALDDDVGGGAMDATPFSPSQPTLALLVGELRRHLPFSTMALADVRAFVGASRESYHAPGERLFAPHDGVVQRLVYIRRGTVRADRGGLAPPVHHEAGDLLPIAALLGERAVTSTYEAEEDAFCLEVDAGVVRQIASRSAPFADFLHRRLERLLEASRRQLRRAQAAALLEERSLEAPLAELPRREPVACAPRTPLREALQRMHAARVGSIVALDDAGAAVGILTRHDLLERVVLAEVPLETPVATVMSSPVATLTLHDSVQQAMLEMSRRGIRHLPVTDGGRVVGMVSARDLFALQRQSMKQIGLGIRQAAHVPALAAAAAQIRRFARHLIGQGLSSPSLTSILSQLNDQLTERLVQLTAAAQGLDLREACWLAFGSEGRSEQTVATDQDNGLVLAAGADRPRWLAFGRSVNAGLATCGYPLCEGGVMAGNDPCCLTVEGWRERFARWMERNEPADLLAASIFFDLRPLAGRHELAAPLVELIRERAPQAALFLRLMAGNALQRRVPLNWRGALDASQDGGHGWIDLKLQGTAIFVDAARLLALAHGISATGTRERLVAAAQAGGVPAAEGAAWVSAFDHLQLLRLRGQLAAHEPHRANRVDVGELDAIDRRVLKEAFRIARDLQHKIELDFVH